MLLNSSPGLANEVEWLRQVGRVVNESAPQPTGDAGLQRALARIRAERDFQPAQPRREQKEKTSFFAWPRFAFGLAMAVVAVQAVVIATLVARAPETPSSVAPLAGSPQAASGALIQLTFKPEATELQIRGLVSGIEGEIVGGPGALGVYTVRVPKARAAGALQSLRQNPLVESASALDS